MVYSSGLKSVFEKHPFREELVWAEGLTEEIAELRFHIAVCMDWALVGTNYLKTVPFRKISEN